MKKYITTITIFFAWFMASAQTSCYVATGSNDILLVDYQNCSYQFICNTGFYIGDLAITPNGTMYVVDVSVLYKLNLSDCSTTVIMDTVTHPATNITSLVALDDRYLFGAGVDAVLYKIDVVNGTSVAVDTIKDQVQQYYSAGDLTWYKGKLYYCADPNYLVAITLNETFDRITNVTQIGTMHPNYPYGAVTVGESNCDGDNLKMLVFSFDTIYLANPVDASLQFACETYTWYALGATSMSEVLYQSPDTSSVFTLPNVFTPNGDNLNDYFEPKTAKNIFSIKIDIYNRWGNKVYSYKGDSLKWNGKDESSNTCSEGTYYYLVEYETLCGGQGINKRHGYLSLIR